MEPLIRSGTQQSSVMKEGASLWQLITSVMVWHHFNGQMEVADLNYVFQCCMKGFTLLIKIFVEDCSCGISPFG